MSISGLEELSVAAIKGQKSWGHASAGNARDSGSISGLGKSLGGRNGNPLQYFCLENPMDREAWWATVHWVARSQTRLKRLSTHSHQDNGDLYQKKKRSQA